jgi:putative DNA primase/helicase
MNCKENKDRIKELQIQMKQAEKSIANYRSEERKLGMSRASKGILEKVLSLCKNYDYGETLDRSPHELPLSGGKIINLKTLQVREREHKDRWSFELKVRYLSDNPDPDGRWKRFFSRICNNQGEQSVDYMLESLAYCLTGDTFERKMYMFWGHSCNGKSTLIDLMKQVLGVLYTAISEQVFMSQARRSSTTPESIPLKRPRLAVFSESKKGDNLDSTRLKLLTGNDDISARQLYEKQINFRPQSKYILLTNHLPDFNIDDQAMVDRIALLSFQNKFSVTPENKAFVNSLTEEAALDGLFTILARKAKTIYERGRVMDAPAMVQHAFKEYTSELNTIQHFIDKKCVLQESKKVVKKKIYEAYCEFTGTPNDTNRVFYAKMMKRGFKIVRSSGNRFFKGIYLRPNFLV